MAYYWTCPYCGAHLDRGERCDCQNEEKEQEDAAEWQQISAAKKELVACKISA